MIFSSFLGAELRDRDMGLLSGKCWLGSDEGTVYAKREALDRG